MLIGFEKETHDLTADELSLVPLLVGTLQYKVGVKAAVTNTMLCNFLRACTGEDNKPIKVTDVRMRKLINHIRMKDLVPGLLASSKGYYVSNDPKEVKEYIQSLQGRENAIKGIRVRTQMYLNTMITNQGSLNII
jgi:hypothetical protein